jgi:hypothetical protein
MLVGLLLGSISSNYGALAQTSSPTGIIVPLYIYPGADWDALVKVKSNSSGVPIVAIVNPNSGVGKIKDPNYVTGIKKLKDAGIIVLGYVWTNYTNKSTFSAKAEIDKYKSWYAVNGIFLDGMSTAQGKEWYYRNLDTYAKSKGLGPTIGNPGTTTRLSYFSTVDNIIVYEGSGTPSLTYLAGWYSKTHAKNFSFLAYRVATLDDVYVKESVKYAGYLYITNDGLNNPYDSLPSYLPHLVSVVQKVNSS